MKIFNKDPKMKDLIKIVGPCTLEVPKRPRLFSSLARAIVYQQLSGKAAQTIYGRFLALFEATNATLKPEHVQQASLPTLRTAGLSEAKAKSVKDLSDKILDGTLPSISKLKKMENEKLIETLTQVRGIGPWSAEMFMMFTLGREDLISTGDLGLQKGFAKLYNKRKLPTAEQFSKAAENWKPYRTIACWYLWRILDLPNN
ncbi:MAG: DNA-3-methyladenine glycosylase 2 family protein [Halobacteriovoraceae bacterium]|nr:DNA-3-methyladenine glycosylase 2 family protein [Halobacteriovoraceae bacterium]MCB9093897.1 DNA-3-methyladenine glycosylase 2 family protein [Halobacteriovoraceae bacterium]